MLELVQQKWDISVYVNIIIVTPGCNPSQPQSIYIGRACDCPSIGSWRGFQLTRILRFLHFGWGWNDQTPLQIGLEILNNVKHKQDHWYT